MPVSVDPNGRTCASSCFCGERNKGDPAWHGADSESNHKWRVLDADQANNGNADGIFLLSEYYLLTYNNFGTMLAEDVAFDSESQVWQGSDAQNLCKDWYGKFFTQPEQNSIISVSKTDAAVNLYGISWAASSLSADHLFFLSVQELADYVGSYTSNFADRELPYLKAHHDYLEGSAADWWLRSPHLNDGNDVGFVNTLGFVDHYNASTLARARPAFNINRESVLFTSAATDVKTSANFGDGSISEIPTTNTSEWKLTLLDNSRHFSVTENTATGKNAL